MTPTNAGVWDCPLENRKNDQWEHLHKRVFLSSPEPINCPSSSVRGRTWTEHPSSMLESWLVWSGGCFQLVSKYSHSALPGKKWSHVATKQTSGSASHPSLELTWTSGAILNVLFRCQQWQMVRFALSRLLGACGTPQFSEEKSATSVLLTCYTAFNFCWLWTGRLASLNISEEKTISHPSLFL